MGWERSEGKKKYTYVDVLHVSHLTSDGVELLGCLTDVVTVLHNNTNDRRLLHSQAAFCFLLELGG